MFRMKNASRGRKAGRHEAGGGQVSMLRVKNASGGSARNAWPAQAILSGMASGCGLLMRGARNARPAQSILGGLLLACLAAAPGAQSQAPGNQGEEPSAATQAEAAQAPAASQYQEGVHYARLPVPVDTDSPGRIEVVEVFSYACVHCYRLDPVLEDWIGKLPEDVAFLRVPAIFNQTWALFGRLFYAAEALGVQEQVHAPIFEATHQRGQDLRNLELAEKLFEQEAGVPPEDFRKALQSFDVHNRLRQADAKGRAYRLSGVPTLIVNGKYRIEIDMAGTQAGMLEIADFLIAQERALAQSPN